ncbi:MAG: LuxR family transcriptional regulator [Spirochaetota bacterium]
MRLHAGSHLLHLSLSLAERLSLFEHVLGNASRTGRRIVAIVDPQLRVVFEQAAALAHVRARQLTIGTVDELVPEDGGWKQICAAVDEIVDQGDGQASGWRLDEPGSETMVLCDLDRVFERCSAASEMMSVVYSLHQNHAAHKRCVVEAVSVEAIPRSIPTEFFDVHTDWVFSPEVVPSAHDGQTMDGASLRVALETPEFRNQFLALARSDSESALRLVPRMFADFRRGFLILDQRFVVRHCSPRAAALLRRSVDEIEERPLNTCIDGVDLVTLKRECARPAGNEEGPFVVSWRLAPGSYEPREVTTDPITSEHRTVGYVVSIAPVQSVRGPRAVYRQLSEERSAEPVVSSADDEPTPEEALNESLQGTQITRREHEVLLLILSHHSNRDIARTLDIAEVTVKKHLTSIYRKLRITNRNELIRSFVAPHHDDSGQGAE